MIFRNFVEIDNNKFEYESGTWRRTRDIRSSRNTTQNAPSYNYDGVDKGSHSLVLLLNTASSNWGVSTHAASQLNLLDITLAKVGVSIPVLFVDPVGRTYNVVPAGSIVEELSPNSIYGDTTSSIDLVIPITLNES